MNRCLFQNVRLEGTRHVCDGAKAACSDPIGCKIRLIKRDLASGPERDVTETTIILDS